MSSQSAPRNKPREIPCCGGRDLLRRGWNVLEPGASEKSLLCGGRERSGSLSLRLLLMLSSISLVVLHVMLDYGNSRRQYAIYIVIYYRRTHMYVREGLEEERLHVIFVCKAKGSRPASAIVSSQNSGHTPA